MFTSMTARVSTNTYCLARTRRFSRRSENSVGRATHEREAPTDTVQLVSVPGCVGSEFLGLHVGDKSCDQSEARPGRRVAFYVSTNTHCSSIAKIVFFENFLTNSSKL